MSLPKKFPRTVFIKTSVLLQSEPFSRISSFYPVIGSDIDNFGNFFFFFTGLTRVLPLHIPLSH